MKFFLTSSKKTRLSSISCHAVMPSKLFSTRRASWSRRVGVFDNTNIKSQLNEWVEINLCSMSPIMSSISRKISQVSRFTAKSPDSHRNKFVFLAKQPSRFEAYLWPDVIWVACVAWRPAASPLLRPARQNRHATQAIIWTRQRLKVSFKAIFNAHFINLVSKEYFSYNVL